MNNYDDKLHEILPQAEEYMYELVTSTSDIMWKECSSLNKKTIFNRNQIYLNTYLTTESIVILLGQGKLWDAEILNRCVLEWTIKYLYLCLGDINTTIKKVEDFSELIPNLNAVKRSNKVEELLKTFEDKESIKLKPLHEMLLTGIEKEEYYQDLNKTDRKNIENKWSFNAMLKSLIDHDKKYESLLNLTYQYSMSSHLIHMDGDAVGMIWERTQRNKEELDLLEFSQKCRLISDLMGLCLFRTQLIFDLSETDLLKIQEIKEKYKTLYIGLNNYGKLFSDKYY